MIDLNKLHVFNVVAQAGSFSAAADRLYITQSAVSQHIKELETGLGRQLFQRCLLYTFSEPTRPY